LSPPKPPPDDCQKLKATWPSLPDSSIVIGAFELAVKLYQAVPIWPLQICGSPGSSVVALRSPLSEKGKLEIACASAKLSFDGGEALAGEGAQGRQEERQDGGCEAGSK